MTKLYYWLSCVLFSLMFFCVNNSCYAQNTKIIVSVDSSSVYKVELKDGTVLEGKIVSQIKDTLLLKTTSLGTVKVAINSVKHLTVESRKKGQYSFPNPNATRYLFGPSAFSLGKGEGYYQNTYLDLSSFDVGISDNISIGGGFELVATFASLSDGDFQPIFFVTPKIAFHAANKLHLGGGVLYASLPYIGNSSNFNGRGGVGILYGMATYGTIEHNVTLSTGWGFVNQELAKRPIITVSGMTRLSDKIGLVSENWIVPQQTYHYNPNPNISLQDISYSYYPVFSYGVRFIGNKMSVDLALINNKDIAQVLFIGIPYFDFVVKF